MRGDVRATHVVGWDAVRVLENVTGLDVSENVVTRPLPADMKPMRVQIGDVKLAEKVVHAVGVDERFRERVLERQLAGRGRLSMQCVLRAC